MDTSPNTQRAWNGAGTASTESDTLAAHTQSKTYAFTPSQVQQKWSSLGNNAIRDVWATNLEEEFANIREAVIECPYVALDTEFPGIVARPLGSFRTTHEFYYQTLRCNVNILKIIQLGITLCDAEGCPPSKGPSTWQFNFRFCLSDDIYAEDSIHLLTSSGIDFGRFEREGVDLFLFAQLMTSSGLVLCPRVQWLSFHAGYDFGYVVKALTNQDLPEREADFFDILRLYFPTIYDIKYVLKETDYLSHQIGLDALADATGVRRIGPAHQAGSDSLLTALCFFKLLREYCSTEELPVSTRGVLYGLGDDYATNSSTPLVGSSTASLSNSANNGGGGSTFPSTPNLRPTTGNSAAGGSQPSGSSSSSHVGTGNLSGSTGLSTGTVHTATIPNSSLPSSREPSVNATPAAAAVPAPAGGSSSSAYINSVVYHGMAPPGKAVTHNQHASK